MKKQIHKKQVRNFWEEKGASRSPGKLVTHKDHTQVKLEINAVLGLLNKSDILLDVGCGNGFATAIYAKKCRRTVGLDYSATMIKAANKANTNKTLHFEEADVLNLKKSLGPFTKILSTRCLINLSNWREQKKALKNLHNQLIPGGYFLLMEGIKQGRDNLNQFRLRLGLPAMPKVWHNKDFDLNRLLPFLEEYFILEKTIGFGVYDVLTRAYYPAYIAPHSARYRSKHHDTAFTMYYALPENTFNEYSRELCFVLKKK